MPQEEFQNVASAGIIVLLVILILMNGVAIILRNKFSKNSNLNKLSHLSIKKGVLNMTQTLAQLNKYLKVMHLKSQKS